MPELRLLISGGGTAGHVYPALAMLSAWPGGDTPEVLWVGSADGMEREIVAGAGLPFVGVAAGALRGKALHDVGLNAARLAAGYVQALRATSSFRPDVVLTTGGYVSAPVALAARSRGVPVVVFLPDVKPGLAVRAQRRIATRVAASFDESRRWLPAERTVVTGYPVRPALLAADRTAARAAFGVPDDAVLLLVYGGSRGARTLNEGILGGLPELLARCHIVHVGGTLDHVELARRTASLPPAQASRYQLHAYLGDRLVDALAAADLAVVRAGASTLAELPAVGLPAVVVPGPFSDQETNADYLASRGAAVKLANAAVQRGSLPALVGELLADEPRRRSIAAAARALARPHAAEALIAELRAAARSAR